MTGTELRARLQRAAPLAVALALFVAALEVIRLELSAVSWHELSDAVLTTPATAIATALGLSALNYLVLTTYDLLAFAYIGRRLAAWRIAGASFLAYAVSNNIGFAMLSGASVRFRFYTRWGITPAELSRIVFSYSITFWLGLLALGGASLIVSAPALAALPAAALLRPAGIVLLVTPFLYLAATVVRRAPLQLGRFTLPLPHPGIAAGQFLVSVVDWVLVGAVLFVLLPPGHVAFLPFLGAFLAATLAGMVSHVPGGMGVFEGLMVLLLRGTVSSTDLLPALVVFRVVYYFLPLAVALVALVVDEIWRQREPLGRAARTAVRFSDAWTPRVLSVFVFFSGLVLLFSGATPADAERLAVVARVFPLGVIEASHFLGSIAGVLLLVLAQGLTRRLDGAFYATAAALTLGGAASLVKGFDYEEAAIVTVTLVLLWRTRSAFDRRAAFLADSFSPQWFVAVAGGIAASVWLGLFAYKHVDYAHELWWQFELGGEASRFLRGTVGIAVVFLATAVARLVRHAPHDAPLPSAADIADAARIIATQPSTFPFLVYLGDKALLFNDARTGFVMYGVQGRTWVALGDPVGPPEVLPALVRLFLERCADAGGAPVFYEVGTAFMHLYANVGFAFAKLGEEAQVDLAAFSLEGGRGSRHRQTIRRLEREGRTFRVLPPEAVPQVLDQLRAVSDDWLAVRSTAEKGFSLGYFDEAYLSRFPVAVVEFEGRIEAFANLWPGAGKQELSLDLMRFHRNAPRSVMEALLVHVMLWGQQEGYRRFTLGMAPMSGLEVVPAASWWNRVGAFLYEHADAFYNFQGLRAYKDKFDPIWEPHYLAYSGGLRLPRVMADVSALIAGGYRRIFSK